MIGILSILGWLAALAALAAILSGCASPTTSSTETISPLPAESISSEDIVSYARAIWAIEPSRQAAYKEIQQIVEEDKIPEINCTKPDTITSLPRNVQDIAVNYCNQAKKIGESNGLTIPQFNGITATAQSNPQLQQRIQNELIRLQR